MASMTLIQRYSRIYVARYLIVLPVVLLLSRTRFIICNRKLLALGFNLLWLFDDLLSWRRLSDHPGPWFASLSSLPTVWHIWKGDFYEWLECLHSKHGSTIRKSHIHQIWLPSLTLTRVSDLIDFPHMMSTSSAHWITKTSGARDLDGTELLSTLIRSTNPT
jgi:hypothetical protein